jgi:hypothetical protein
MPPGASLISRPEHLQLPIARAFFIVVLGAFEGLAELAVAAIGAEAEIDAVAHALGGVSGEHLREGGGSAFEGLAIGAGIDEHEVDIGAVVELAAA